MVGPLVRIPLVRGAPLVPAAFVARPNRFVVEARLEDGSLVAAHLADRGRLIDLLTPDARLLLGHMPAPGRKTAYQVAAVETPTALVSLDTALPNRLIEAALRARLLPQFAALGHLEREVAVGASRFDFGLAPAPPANGGRIGAAAPCLIEVKSIGALSNGVALFPDAPTSRGARHLAELAELATTGRRTAVIFVAQRADAGAAAVNELIDPGFAAALAAARAAGVEAYAYACPVAPAGIALGPAIPLLAGADALARWQHKQPHS